MNTTESPELMTKLKTALRVKAREILDKAFDDAKVNVIVGTCDSGFCVHAAAAGEFSFPLSSQTAVLLGSNWWLAFSTARGLLCLLGLPC